RRAGAGRREERERQHNEIAGPHGSPLPGGRWSRKWYATARPRVHPNDARAQRVRRAASTAAAAGVTRLPPAVARAEAVRRPASPAAATAVTRPPPASAFGTPIRSPIAPATTPPSVA